MAAGKLWTIDVLDAGSGVCTILNMGYEDINYDPAVLTVSTVNQVTKGQIKDGTPFTTANSATKSTYKVERALIAADLAAHVAKSMTTHASDAVTQINAFLGAGTFSA